jgi:hypothetical protein
MTPDQPPAVFDPGNEPYLGRLLLHHFDNLICSCLEQSGKTAPLTHTMTLSPLQCAACQLIPQSINIALSIRELIRQGYLFGAQVLIRPLVERVAILRYLQLHPVAVEVWEKGWHHGEAPGLAKMLTAMLDTIKDETTREMLRPGVRAITGTHNAVIHGKPDSAAYSLIGLGSGSAGQAPSKILDNGDLCDEICVEVIAWLAQAQVMIEVYFPPRNGS